MNIKIDNNVKIIKTNKFKTITIKLVLINEFSKENATILSLLTRVLTNTSKKYNTKRKVINQLFNLYDANLYIGTTPLHKTNIMHFTLKMVNEKFVNEKGLLNKGICFLNEFVNNPNVEDGCFNEHSFNEEKRQLADEIKKVYNNKTKYAVKKAINIMCPDEILSVSALGTLEDLEKITPSSLYQKYIEIIKKSRLLIYVIGDVDDNIISKLDVFKNIGLEYNNESYELYPSEDVVVNEVKNEREKQDINQAKLVMGFRTKTTHNDEDFHVMQLFSMMYGGMFSSNLFINVRENNSLAYDISSQVLQDAKVMLVYAGIDEENKEKTVNIIIDELNKYKNGEIDEELLETAKINAISEIEEIKDYPGEYISFLVKQDLLNQKTSIEEEIAKIKKVTSLDIKKKALEIELDTIFLLGGK